MAWPPEGPETVSNVQASPVVTPVVLVEKKCSASTEMTLLAIWYSQPAVVGVQPPPQLPPPQVPLVHTSLQVPALLSLQVVPLAT